jgi:hypothetical protein
MSVDDEMKLGSAFSPHIQYLIPFHFPHYSARNTTRGGAGNEQRQEINSDRWLIGAPPLVSAE